MDGFDSKKFYGHSLSDDPKLRTTARNYEFKYNFSDHLEKIINRVKLDRQKELLCQTRMPSMARYTAQFFKKGHSEIFAESNIETEIEKTMSRETVVKVMSDAEMEAMISQAINHMPVTTDTSETSISPENVISATITPVEEDNLHLDRVETKSAKVSEELLLAQQPKWVEIKPTEKAIASITSIHNTPRAMENDDNDCTNFSSEQCLDDDEIDTNEITHEAEFSDVISFGSSVSEDFVIRQEESDHEQGQASAQESSTSFGLETTLNECEQAEMDRVLGNTLPHVPDMQFNNLCSQESGLSATEQEDDSEYDEESEITQDGASTAENINVQPMVRITQFQPHNNEPQDEVAITCRSMPKTPKSNRPPHKSPRRTPPASASKEPVPPQTPMDKKMQKQIETLKQDKLRIFSKMTSIQEKLIENLDRLRLNLNELAIPDGQVERKLRERNAIEFSVRFSRNFLFPLGIMIEELRASPKEDYHSAITNEPCVKVCGIYGLLNQALQCYQKQVRHFFIDCVPKKLDVVLNMIADTTKICLRMKIFDKRDTLIQCLLFRCDTFLDFVTAFAEQKTARDEDNQSVLSARKSILKTSSKWDLTMHLNKLNMYEPKLVAKKPKVLCPKKPRPLLSSRGTLKCKDTSRPPVIPVQKVRETVTHPPPDPTDTQVRRINDADSVRLIKTIIDDQPDSELTKTVIETLQDITKDEVRQLLNPIVLSLDTLMKNPDNPQTVESMLGLLNLCKQVKIDPAATENSTQNSNTYQKKVTKKGADSSKFERRKENRPRRVSKSNVKEGSTEQTKRYNARDGRTDSMRDKQSLSNVDVSKAAVGKNNSTKHTTRSQSVVGGRAFPSAKQPTKAVERAPAAIGTGNGIPPPSLALSSVQLDEVMPLTPVQAVIIQKQKMTSQRVEYSSNPSVVVSIGGKFAPKCHGIRSEVGYRKEVDASQSKVRDGAANAFEGTEGNKETWRKNPPSSSPRTKNGTAMSGQMEQLNYYSNAQYTFVKHCEDIVPHPEVQNVTNENYIPEEECFADSYTKLASSARLEINAESCISLPGSVSESESESNRSLAIASEMKKKEENDIRNEQDIKALLEERNHFIEQCKENQLYTNSQFPKPWKVLSNISQSIACEIFENFEKDLSFGEESYVEDFINMEMQT